MDGTKMAVSATSAGQKWWIITRTSGARGGPPVQMPVQSQGKPVGAILGPFGSQAAAIAALNKRRNQTPPLPNVKGAIQGFFGGLGGMIAGGIESGFITSVKDIWDVIIGPLQVLAGIALAIIVLTIYFKDDITAGVLLAAKLASGGVA
jgi:hypothetical protein